MSDLKTKISNFFNRMFKKIKKEQETFVGGNVSAKAREDLMKPLYPVDIDSDDPWADSVTEKQIDDLLKKIRGEK